jgi:hypothetical protein
MGLQAGGLVQHAVAVARVKQKLVPVRVRQPCGCRLKGALTAWSLMRSVAVRIAIHCAFVM